MSLAAPVTIYGLGTATPAHSMSQEQALQLFQTVVCDEDRQARMASVLFRKAEVQQRHTVLHHQAAYNWCQLATTDGSRAAVSDRAIPPTVIPAVRAGQSAGPTTGERMELYARFAADLALAAAERALENAAVSSDEITHLVVVTCTGFDAPGVDLELIDRLALPRTTQRIQVGFMGCHGAINGIRTARAIAAADPAAKVLLCAVELCSLHYRFTWDPEGIIGNALFADGAGALVIGSQAQEETVPVPRWHIVDTGSVVIGNSREAMSWRVGDHGFEMRLTSDVGEKIETELGDWLVPWLGSHQLSLADVKYWGVHPGGPRILTAVEQSLALEPQALSVSRSVLQRYGNMSSPTVLFILDEFRRARMQQTNVGREYGVLLGFGPGLVAEIALVSVC